MKNPILEYTPKGWIKLHRELEGKGIFKEPDLLQLYIYLMFHAMTDDTEYRGVIISRGQLALTYGSLSKTLNISQRRVRTLLGKLVLAQELACSRAYSGAHSFTIVTICNYDKYQGAPKGKRLNSQPMTSRMSDITERFPPYIMIKKDFLKKKLRKQVIFQRHLRSLKNF